MSSLKGNASDTQTLKGNASDTQTLKGNASDTQTLKGSASGTQSLSGGSAINIAATPEIEVGTVTTLEPNADVVVELDETSTKMNPVFNFGIPKGEKGEKGDAGSVRFKITNVLPDSSIKWDGKTSNKETINVDFDTLYKVSDLVLTEEQLIGGTYKITRASGVTEYQTEITYVTSDKNVFKVNNGINNYIAVIKQSTEEYPQSPGIYFYYDGWGPTYTSSLSVILFEKIDEEAIYMIPSNGNADNSYDEYVYINNHWEKMGSAQVEVDLDNYVKKTDYASSSTAGVVKINSSYGIWKFTSGAIYISAASETQIKDKTSKYNPIVPSNLDYAVKSVVGGHITLTQAEYDLYFEPDENTYYYIVEE